MEDKVCEEIRKRIDERIETHENRLNSLTKKIISTELVTHRLEERMGGVVQQLEQLNSTLRWLIGTMITALAGFFIYMVQNKLM